jgi:hypothetical protein
MDSRSPRALTGAEKARERAWRLLAEAKATAVPKGRKQLLAEALKLAQLADKLEAGVAG